jgi:hypothetical protein
LAKSNASLNFNQEAGTKSKQTVDEGRAAAQAALTK